MEESTALPNIGPSDAALIPRIKFPEKAVRLDLKNKALDFVNAKGSVITECDFSYSIVRNGYFRRAKFSNCRFVGATFYECVFKDADFYQCDFSFARFYRCVISASDLVPSLPLESNIRRENLQNLRANAVSIGDHRSGKPLVLAEIEAHRDHYRRAFLGSSDWYRKKYPATSDRLTALVRLGQIWISDFFWGHGEKPWRILFSGVVLVTLLGFINLWSVVPRVGWSESGQGFEAFSYVFPKFLGVQPDDRFQGFVVVDYVLTILRYLYVGLFLSALYKSIAYR